jgi:hypothetical protein
MLQLKYVRDELASALLSFSKPERNQIVAMAERSAAASKFTAKPMREISVDAAVVIVEAEPVRYTEGKKFRTSSIPVSPQIFRQVSWRNALHQLPTPYKTWLNYCYGDQLSFEDQTFLTQHVWNIIQLYHKETYSSKMSSKTEKNMKGLSWLAIQETKNLVNRESYKYTQKELSKLCNITYDNWRKNYQTRWELILQCISQLDNEALIHVEQQRKKSCRNMW